MRIAKKTMRYQLRLRRIERVLLVIGLLLSHAGSAPTLCPGSTTEFGYTSIANINADIASEVARIQSGATPNGMYTYNLCSNTIFDANPGPLRPALSNSFFICGPDGLSSNNCPIVGGSTQVEVVDSPLADIPLGDVTFLGLQFTGFTTRAVSASASLPTKANFRDVTWSSFTSTFVIQQTSNSTDAPMSIDIANSTVRDGTAGVIFTNDGGSLRIQALQATGVTSPALIATSNGGNAFFQDSLVSASQLDYVTDTLGAAAQSVINVQVSNMQSMVTAFRVTDAGSELSVTGSSIIANQIAGRRWTGVEARSGARAQISDMTMSANDGIAFVFSSVGASSRVIVTDSLVEQNAGTASARLISAPGVALSQGRLSVTSSQFDQNSGFSAAILALQGSQIDMEESCFTNSESQYLAFVDRTSDYSQQSNFVSEYVTRECATGVGRLFKESNESGCFEGSNICTGECMVMANATVCLASVSPTSAPVTPTVAPTGSGTGTIPPSSEATTELLPSVAPSARPSATPTTVPSATSMPSVVLNVTEQPTVGATIPPSTGGLTRPPNMDTSSPVPAPTSTPTDETILPEPSPTRRPQSLTISPTACPTNVKGSKSLKTSKSIKGSSSKGKGKGKGSHSSYSSHSQGHRHSHCPPSTKGHKGGSKSYSSTSRKGKGGAWSSQYGSGTIMYVSGSEPLYSGSYHRDLHVRGSTTLKQKWHLPSEHIQ